MAYYAAVPVGPDGDDRTDQVARDATVSGSYLYRDNFERYAFARRATLPGQYNLYVWEGFRRVFLGRLYRRADA